MSLVSRHNLLEARASALHILQATEDVGKYRITATRSHVHHVHVFDRAAIHKTSRRVYFQSVVIHVDVNFTSQFQIVTMNEGIYQSFFYGTLWVLWVFKAIVRGLTPSLL